MQEVLARLTKANQLMENLIDMALADEQLSEEEKKILYSINSNLEKYAKLIIESVSDGKIIESEMAKIIELEKQMVADAESIIKEAMTEDTKKLFDELVETIKSMSN